MKTINAYITEKLKLNNQSKLKEITFTDEELREDYETIGVAYTKAEKLEIATKYNVQKLKIRDIQLVILEYLRKNRNNKSEFTEEDIWDFFRLDPPDGVYKKFKIYLEQEQDIFLKYMLNYYTDKITAINKRRRQNGYGYSYADKRIIRIVDFLKTYLKVA